jgi:hypothetical protein
MIDDKELFQSALSDEPIVEAAETVVTEPVVETVARDEQGRFAPKVEATEQAAPAEATQVVQPKTDEAHVPSWRLREVNDKAEAAERRARELEDRATAFERQIAELSKKAEPKPEPVDFFQNPDEALAQRLSPLEANFQMLERKLTLRASRAENISEHGIATVKEMEAALEKASQERHPDIPQLSAQMRNSHDPVGVAMQWYQRDKLLKETGGDLTTYRTKTLDDALKDPAFLAKAAEAFRAHASGQPSQGKNIVQLPPSIGRATSAASPHEDAGDMSERSLWAAATK